METVYLETTVVGTIASRDHPDPIMLARQLSTRQWWTDAPSRFDLKISDLVIAECNAGDPAAASERLKVVDGLDILAPNDDAETLAEVLMVAKAVPKTEPRDAAHIALSAVHGMNYLVTWNFKHILNPHLQNGSIRSAVIRGLSLRRFAHLNNYWNHTMTPNPIDEIKQIRHQLGADANFDIHRIFAELRASQASSGRSYVQGSRRRTADNNAIHRSGEAGRSGIENLSSPPGDR